MGCQSIKCSQIQRSILEIQIYRVFWLKNDLNLVNKKNGQTTIKMMKDGEELKDRNDGKECQNNKQ
jgi:hypothetical protein